MWWRVNPAPGIVSIPPEPPVAVACRAERPGVVKGAPVFGAAQRTLDNEDRSATRGMRTGGSGDIDIYPAGELRAGFYCAVCTVWTS